MTWWNTNRADVDEEICIGDYITNKGSHTKNYFKDGPLKVTRIEYNKPIYAGGAFVYGYIDGKEQGFYINAVKKTSKFG